MRLDDVPARGNRSCHPTPRTSSFKADMNAAGGANDVEVFLAYENLAAALRVWDWLSGLSRRDPAGIRVRLSSWSFDLLSNRQMRARASSHFERAQLILVAMCSSAPELPDCVLKWLQGSLTVPRLHQTAVVGLFHDCNGCDDLGSARLRALRRVARRAGCAFFAPGIPTSAQ